MLKSVLSSAVLVALFAGPAAAEALRIQVGNAEVGEDPATSQPILTITLKPESKTAFGEFTRAHIGKQITVRVGSTPISEPFILEPILEGRIVISGQMTRQDAKALVDLIAAADGALDVEGKQN